MSDNHLALDALADALAAREEGLPDPEHLQSCPHCRARLGELAAAMPAVSRALASLPLPEVPADLEERIAAALGVQSRPAAPVAEEVAASSREPDVAVEAPPAAGPLAAAATVIPMTAASSRRPRWIAPAGGVAAAAVLIAGGFVLLGGKSTPPKRTAASALTAGGSGGIAHSSTGTDYKADGVALKAGLAALLKGNAPGAASVTSAQAPAQDSTVPKTAAGTAGPEGFSADKVTADPLAALRTVAGLASCVSALSDPSDPGIPLALDYGSFAGKPALLVLLPSPKAGYVEAYFVGALCSAADPKLLFFEKLKTP